MIAPATSTTQNFTQKIGKKNCINVNKNTKTDTAGAINLIAVGATDSYLNCGGSDKHILYLDNALKAAFLLLIYIFFRRLSLGNFTVG